MKNFMVIALVLLTLTACEVTVVEPAYDYRINVVGSYEMDEYSSTYNDYFTYNIYINKSTSSVYHVYLDNFYAANISVKAYVDGGNITIPYQVVDGYEVDGEGTLVGNKIYLSYRVRDQYNNSIPDYCQATAYRSN